MDEQHQASIFVNSLSVVKSNPLVTDLSWNNIGIETCLSGNTKVKELLLAFRGTEEHACRHDMNPSAIAAGTNLTFCNTWITWI